MTGQSTVLLICSERPYLGRDLIPLGHAIAGRHLVVGALVATGGSLRWFRDNLADAERAQAVASGEDIFDLMGHEASQAEAGAGGVLFLPWMAGERSPIWDSRARGVFCGLSLKSTRGDMIRSIFEGAAFGLRHNLETAQSAGFQVQRLSSVGGGARSALWNQIKADILQRTLHLPAAATGAPMGNVILASVAVGLHPTIEAAVAAMVRQGSVVQPDAARSARYDAFYRVYQGLHPALRNSFAELAQAVQVP
jgi:xylulokinase